MNENWIVITSRAHASDGSHDTLAPPCLFFNKPKWDPREPNFNARLENDKTIGLLRDFVFESVGSLPTKSSGKNAYSRHSIIATRSDNVIHAVEPTGIHVYYTCKYIYNNHTNNKKLYLLLIIELFVFNKYLLIIIISHFMHFLMRKKIWIFPR